MRDQIGYLWAAGHRARRAHIVQVGPDDNGALCGFEPINGWVTYGGQSYIDITRETACWPCLKGYQDIEGFAGPLDQANRFLREG